jgi:hypothetical protein
MVPIHTRGSVHSTHAEAPLRTHERSSSSPRVEVTMSVRQSSMLSRASFNVRITEDKAMPPIEFNKEIALRNCGPLKHTPHAIMRLIESGMPWPPAYPEDLFLDVARSYVDQTGKSFDFPYNAKALFDHICAAVSMKNIGRPNDSFLNSPWVIQKIGEPLAERLQLHADPVQQVKKIFHDLLMKIVEKQMNVVLGHRLPPSPPVMRHVRNENRVPPPLPPKNPARRRSLIAEKLRHAQSRPSLPG